MAAPIKKEIERLKEEIRSHDYKYYALSQPEISDSEYDALIKKLLELEEKYPQYKTDDSPSVRVGGKVLEGFKTVRHKQKMLSLDNTYSLDELAEWDERVRKALGKESYEYAVELKMDGVSANITYESGKFTVGATRGDGETGEDITQNLKTIRAIPLALRGEDIPEFIEMRGEVYMDRKDFDILNKEKEISGGALFANPRNAASGSLKLLDTSVVSRRRLNFFAHSLGEYKGGAIQSQWEFLKKARLWGMRCNPASRLCKDLGEVIDYCKTWQAKRDVLSFEIDGIVVKVNNIEQQKKLGFTLKSPRWAVAYKFPARQATTTLKDIKMQVGRTGVITPVAELEPVECSGVVIKHATLHNFDEIKRLHIKKGDRVLIERAGDVIPKVVKVVQSLGREAPRPPQKCPACGGAVKKEKDEEVAFRCINPSCPAQLERGLCHFASRGAMDIEGMGESVISQLIAKEMVKDFSDIYSLKKEALLRLELFKDKKAQNLISAIGRSKRQPLSRLIYGLGIRHVGEKAAYVLARRFRTMDNLMKAKKQDLEAIYEIGEVMARSIVEFFSLEATKNLVEKLRKANLNFIETTASVHKGSPLSGKRVVFTGELKDFTRPKAEALAREFGANVSSGVSRNTDFVVAGENPGSKYDSARKLNVKIIGEREFKEMIQ